MRRSPASSKHVRRASTFWVTRSGRIATRRMAVGIWGRSPSKKAVARIKEKVGNLLIPSNTGTWEEVRNRLNQILRGWSAYFSYGTRTAAYGAVDNHVYESVRHFLRRRHQVQSRGTDRFSIKAVFGELGVLRLRRIQVTPRS